MNMNPVVIGTPDEVLGFALAGATTLAATTDAEVEKAIDRAKKTIEEPIIILVRGGRIDFVLPE